MNEKWCRFEMDGVARYGKIAGDTAGAETVEAIDGTPWGEYRFEGRAIPLASVKLLVPTIPSTFFCVGINYREHILTMAALKNTEPKFPSRPDVGFRANTALRAPGDSIIKPRDSTEQFQYEGELVAVIGKEARNVKPEDALRYVFGFTIGNDVSERTWQRNDRTNWRAKNSATFKPMGPWIVTGLDYRTMTTTVRLNGEQVNRFATAKMIFDIETYIAAISQYCTLMPGDVLWMGTDGEARNMVPGDVCEIEITGIGTLRNPIAAEGNASE